MTPITPKLPSKRPADPRLARQDPKLEAVRKTWQALFESPIHLDSAISKLTPASKSVVSRLLPAILRCPVSLAEALGVGVDEGEPWSLHAEERAEWKPLRPLAERLMATLEEVRKDPASVREDFPPEWIEAWERDWGTQTTDALVREMGAPAPFSLRIARRKSPFELLKEIGSSIPVKAKVSDFAPFGLRLEGYAPIMNLPAYLDGTIEIQDEGSQIMALFALWPELYQGLLSATPGAVRRGLHAAIQPPPEAPAWTVVDACAGAGGKSLALADALQGKGRVYSYDTSITKLQALRRRATRAGHTNIQSVQVTEGRESETTKKFKRRAQRVLVDAPCSGWGVVRRNPDIKWRQDESVLDRMPGLQGRLLQEYSELVAPGGRLVYGVCTFRPEETRGVVDTFLSQAPNFEKEAGGFLGPGPCDGFFMQSFVRGS